jgi:hypothetical protein
MDISHLIFIIVAVIAIVASSSLVVRSLQVKFLASELDNKVRYSDSLFGKILDLQKSERILKETNEKSSNLLIESTIKSTKLEERNRKLTEVLAKRTVMVKQLSDELRKASMILTNKQYNFEQDFMFLNKLMENKISRDGRISVLAVINGVRKGTSINGDDITAQLNEQITKVALVIISSISSEYRKVLLRYFNSNKEIDEFIILSVSYEMTTLLHYANKAKGSRNKDDVVTLEDITSIDLTVKSIMEQLKMRTLARKVDV